MPEIQGITVNAAYNHDYALTLTVIPWQSEYAASVSKENYHSVGDKIATEFWEHLPAEVVDAFMLYILVQEDGFCDPDIHPEKKKAFATLIWMYKRRMGKT
jgi:hypothetical protein